MRSTLPPVPFKCKPKQNHADSALTADLFYGFGMLAVLSMTCANKSAHSRSNGDLTQHSRTFHVQAASGSQAISVPLRVGSCVDMAVDRSRGACQHPKQTPVRHTVRRKITSSTILRSMHVTKVMADCLGLHYARPHEGDSTGHAMAEVTLQLGGQGQGVTVVNCDRHPAFRRVIALRDTVGNVWPVVYEGSMSNRQYHRRLSDGWGAFCRHHDVKVSDTVEFRRYLKPMSVDSLSVRVIRRVESS